MCNNYRPTQKQLLRDVYGVVPPSLDWKPETWPDYLAPIIRSNADGERDCVLANFRMVPKDRIPPGVKRFDTTNARSETIGERRTFSGPWKTGQLCLVPMESFYEPNYEHGPKSVRYRIWLKDEPTFAVAGLWRDWPDGMFSFTMLTVNAEQHPTMKRMHAPGKEKRSIVIVPREGWDDWLRCRDTEVARSFLGLYPAERMEAEPAPVQKLTEPKAHTL
ncbi:ATP synthase I [Cupriavidus sp. HPC(L)]|uniref:SOS response-associated peptidase n=1 Tax=Cupriavidus sp. HPC(L) TaxID=1217418 RepID=UPI000307DBBA|nr:SOS response-associated peptidase family protein [Cupriavidus sp. HPC(L)]ESH90808.1 ATP synthase I [Cupriavidus sp. HPC(L)]